MIQSVEIWNFESHKHSLFEFGPLMNLLCGKSDSGKSSVLRAICLVAYNRWNDNMLRIGAKTAVVKVTTERGAVTIERGSGVHRWHVLWKEDGVEKEENYTKIGRANVPDKAAWVIGMPKIEVAGTESLPNTMSQMDKPFLLSEFEGKACSSSVVAQVIDELSGLIGLEELLREINLDATRTKRASSELAEKRTALTLKKLQLGDAEEHRKRSVEARKLLDDATEIDGIRSRLGEFSGKVKELKENISGVEVPIAIDFNHCETLLLESGLARSRLVDVIVKAGQITSLQEGKKEAEEVLALSPNCKVISDMLDLTDKENYRLKNAQSLMTSYKMLSREIQSISGILERTPNCSVLSDQLASCTEYSGRAAKALFLAEDTKKTQEGLCITERLLLDLRATMFDSQKELKEIMKDSCPTCGQSMDGSEVLKELLENKK